MANRIFNTPFETMLRLMLLLGEARTPMDRDKITALDFICIYARSCGLAESNINGENRFNFAEFAQKRELVTEALSAAIRRDLISVSSGEGGFSYSLTDQGRKVMSEADSFYAERYRQTAAAALVKLEGKTGVELIGFINYKANEAKGDGYAELLD